jgi:hypothetical protein
MSQPIHLNIGLTSFYGDPTFLKFSPNDSYLAISYKPFLKGDQDYDSLLKIFDMKS